MPTGKAGSSGATLLAQTDRVLAQLGGANRSFLPAWPASVALYVTSGRLAAGPGAVASLGVHAWRRAGSAGASRAIEASDATGQ